MDETRASPQYLAILARRRDALAEQLAEALAGATEFVWELGCGHGHYLTAFAQAHPAERCVGIDIVSERIERARRKAARACLPNLFFLRAEARAFLRTLPPDRRIARALILFPDPWPKSRHHKHRIIQSDFLRELAAHSTNQCQLSFRTDFAPYFEAARSAIASHPAWQLTDEAWPFEAETVFQNRAERSYSLVARRRPAAP
jgi:tRNA (guanine-N7-)-methyltransferase